MNKFFFSLFLVCVTFQYAFAQQNQALSKKSLWIEAKAGLSFYNRELARINNNNIDYQEVNNSLRLEIIPQLNYAIANRLFIGGQIGIGYDSFEEKTLNKNNTSYNYKIGAQLQYYFLKITPQFYLRSELGANFNHLNTNFSENSSNNYLKTYLDAGFSFLPKENWMISIFFKDIFTYHSSAPNFENRNGFESSAIFQDFIRFPHFSVSYQLN